MKEECQVHLDPVSLDLLAVDTLTGFAYVEVGALQAQSMSPV